MTSTWKVDCTTCMKKTCLWFRDKMVGKRWSCKECGKMCQTQKRLVIHENVHREKQISNQQFHCEERPYRTIVKEYLVDQ